MRLPIIYLKNQISWKTRRFKIGRWIFTLSPPHWSSCLHRALVADLFEVPSSAPWPASPCSSCTWPRERQRCDFAKLQREVESRRFCVHSPKMKLCFWNPLRWDIWVVSRKMRGYFSVNQKPSIFRGDIFLDVEICRRWSCYLLLQPLLLLLLSMIVVVKLWQVTFYSKQSNAK